MLASLPRRRALTLTLTLTLTLAAGCASRPLASAGAPARGDPAPGAVQCGADVCASPHTSFTCTPGGQCAVAACEPGWADCDGESSNGCEVDLTTDTFHCGACNQTLCFGAGADNAGGEEISVAPAMLVASAIDAGASGRVLALGARVREAGVTVQLGLYTMRSDGAPDQLLARTAPLTTAGTDQILVGAVEGASVSAAQELWLAALAGANVHFTGEAAQVRWLYAPAAGATELPSTAPPMAPLDASDPDFWMVVAR